jgi:lipopolysaccharide transport protein LptA
LSVTTAKQCHLSHLLLNWSTIAFTFTFALLLTSRPALAQISSQSTLGSHHSARHAVEKPGKIAKTAADDAGQTLTNSKAAKTASVDSTVQNSASPFAALSSSNRGPISIQSDSLALDYKQNAVLFSGHVHATQADGALSSNTLRVTYGKDFHEVQHMAADGNVRISQGVRWCTSDRAVMDQVQHTVVLTGSPLCHDAQDQITGTRITVHLDSGKSDVEAAKAVIFPQQSKTRDNEALADQAK